MSEPHENITEQPDDRPRTTDITNDPPAADYNYSPERFTVPPVEKNKLWSCAVMGTLVFCLSLASIGLIIVGVEEVQTAPVRTQSMYNCKQMVLAVNNIAANMTTSDIPPSYGPFPPGGANQSFFLSLLPYIEQSNLYNNWPNSTNIPVTTYIAPADLNHPGTNSLISYSSNATLLTVGGSPKLPSSFGGRVGNMIVVFERTAKSGATWSSNNSYLIDQNGSSSPEFGSASTWTGTRATALTTAGCVVGLGDGSARVVTPGNANAGWAWAMDPSIPGTQAPAGW